MVQCLTLAFEASVFSGLGTVAAFEGEEYRPQQDQPHAHLHGVGIGGFLEAGVQLADARLDPLGLEGDLLAIQILVENRRYGADRYIAGLSGAGGEKKRKKDGYFVHWILRWLRVKRRIS